MVQSRREYQVTFPSCVGRSGKVIRTGSAGDLCVSYELDLDPLLKVGGSSLDPIAADLIEVMFAIAKTDRICPRGTSSLLAPRNIEVTVPVRHPDLWTSSTVTDLLHSLIHWTSGDSWQFLFTKRLGDPLWTASQVSLWERRNGEATVILNSGGLDSFIGLARLGSQAINGSVVAVTTGRAELIGHAHRVVKCLHSKSTYHPDIQTVGIAERILWPDDARDQREPSWRLRPLFPLAVGAAAAHLGESDLSVFENGIGAIALPMTPDHEGIGATRSMHPKTLGLLAKLVSHVLGRPFRVRNHGLLLTKRQGVEAFISPNLASAVHATHSCPRWSYLRGPCGVCTSCILRRVSLKGTLFEEIEPAVDIQSLAFVAMEFQAVRIRSALSEGSRSFASFLEINEAARYANPGDPPRELLIEKLIALYVEYIAEFDAFAAHHRRKMYRSDAATHNQPVRAALVA